jgi:hypothetical protein
MTLDLEVNEVEVKGLTSLASVTEITGAKVVRRTSYNFQSLFGSQEVNGSSTVDAFFQYLEHGLDGRPLEEYVGVANRLDLVNATSIFTGSSWYK